jgi:hypothetical protein
LGHQHQHQHEHEHEKKEKEKEKKKEKEKEKEKEEKEECFMLLLEGDLYAVPPRLVHRLPRGDVGPDDLLGERSEPDLRPLGEGGAGLLTSSAVQCSAL